MTASVARRAVRPSRTARAPRQGRGRLSQGRETAASVERLPSVCRTCGARWVGTDPAHCAAGCHRTYFDAVAYDAHRRSGACLDPKAAGLIRITQGECEMWLGPVVEVQAWITPVNAKEG